jgi:lipopolysaccharide/colanic/teichoic acid biosynthesis glycosyltransferase
MILTAPILFLAILAIKIENPHAPVFFRQTRYGYMGRPFTMYKLRTMVPEAEKLKSDFIALSEDKGPGFKLEHDPRVTNIGRAFRKFYIDEIPQFLNVVRGDMSLVGPRANSYSPESYEPWQRIRLAVKPGLTGSWQVARNKPTRFDDRCRMDIDYLNRKSLFVDTILMVRTGVMIMTGATGK